MELAPFIEKKPINPNLFSNFRCKVWIEHSGRPELRDKLAVYEDRVCEKHFEPQMFLNDYRNRLQQSAVPILFLEAPVEPPLPAVTMTAVPAAQRPVPKLQPMHHSPPKMVCFPLCQIYKIQSYHILSFIEKQ